MIQIDRETLYSMTGFSAAVATVGALIVAKAILLVEKLPISQLFSHRAILNVLWKTFLFGTVATIFRAIEEFIHAAREQGSIAAEEGLLSAISWPDFLVLQMWLLVLLFTFCLAKRLMTAIGPAEVSRLLLERKP